MNTRALVVLLAASVLATSCAASGDDLRVQGTVAVEVTTVTVPHLAVPAVDLDAGFATVPTPDPSVVTLGDSPTAAVWGIGSVATVAGTSVGEGDAVTAGQQLVQLDDRLLRATVRSAEADAAAAGAQVGVLKAAIGEAEDASQEIADKRADVVDALAELRDKRQEVKQAITKLTKTRSDLKTQQAKARRARADLVAKRKQAQDALAALPPPPAEPPPGLPTREELESAIAQLTAGIKQIDAGLKKMAAGLAQLDRGLRQARTGLTKIDNGITKATNGLADLDDAAEEIADVIAELGRLRRLAAVAAETASVPVQFAATRLAQTSITSPVAGTVLWVAAPGDQLAPGATLVRIRPDEATRLVTWLSPGQAAGVCLGDDAAVQADWMADGELASAQLTLVATAAEFPPTSQATDEVHLTRAFRVELTTPATLPAGVPVSISIQPCRSTTGAP